MTNKRKAPTAPLQRTVGTFETSIVVPVPTTAPEVAKLQREAEADGAAIVRITISDPGTYTLADALLTDAAQKLDAVTAMQKSATGPLYASARTVEGWFRPVRDALTASIAHLKKEMGRYRVDLERRQAEARELAAKAAESGDASALIEAVTIAQPVDLEANASTGFGWAVKRIVPDLLPDEWWTPDVERIASHAKAHKGSDEPVIPGVVFERVAKIGAKR